MSVNPNLKLASLPFEKIFSGLDMLKIDVANTYGYDKLTFEERIQWVEDNIDNILSLQTINSASEPLLHRKAIYALTDALEGKPVRHIMFMDATASGLQIMAILSGCKQTAERVNLINTGRREDIYTFVSNKMKEVLGDNEKYDRQYIKKPIMTHYYNSQAKPRELFNNEELEVFYSILKENFSGAENIMNLLNQCWDTNALVHQWTLPDGHVVKVPVIEEKITRIEVDELGHKTFTYKFYPNQPSKNYRSLAPNIIHSIDAYIAREVTRRSFKMGFKIAHIHDAFCTTPNNMPKVMTLYRQILAEIAESNLFDNIVSELIGQKVELGKYSYNLHKDILQSQYALS